MRWNHLIVLAIMVLLTINVLAFNTSIESDPVNISTNSSNISSEAENHSDAMPAVDKEDSPRKKYILLYSEDSKRDRISEKKQFIQEKKDMLRTKNIDIGDVVEEIPKISALIIEANQAELDNLLDDEDIESVEEDQPLRLFSQSVPWNIERVNAPESWSYATGVGVNIAVIDSGIADHPDLYIAGGVSFIEGMDYNEDDLDHGTSIAGVIAAADNEQGIVGVAPDSNIYSVKVVSGDKGSLATAIQGVDWAIENGMDIIVMSFGFVDESPAFQRLLEGAYVQGILPVAASGRDGELYFPAKYDSVISVGAVDDENRVTSDTGAGPELEFVAPGSDIQSTDNMGGFQAFEGTSMAAPHMAGLAALISEENPTFGPNEIRMELQRMAIDLGDIGRDDEYGYGLGNVDLSTTDDMARFIFMLPNEENPAQRDEYELNPVKIELFKVMNEEQILVHTLFYDGDGSNQTILVESGEYVVIQTIDEVDYQEAYNLSHNETQIILLHKVTIPVHQWIAYQASFIWSTPEIMQYMEEEEYNSGNIWQNTDSFLDSDGYDSYDNGLERAEGILVGAGEEDKDTQGDYQCADYHGNPYCYHFWDPDSPQQGNYNDGLLAYGSNVNVAQAQYDKAVAFYNNDNINQAYYWLGRVAHLIIDMTVPAHVHNDQHLIGDDSYEDTTVMTKNGVNYWNEAKKNFLHFQGSDYFGRYYRYDNLDWWNSNVKSNPSDLFRLFYFTAQKTQHYASDNYDGNNNLRYETGELYCFGPSCSNYDYLWEFDPDYSSSLMVNDDADLSDDDFGDWGDDLKKVSEANIPHAMKAVAGLYRLFWAETHNLVSCTSGACCDISLGLTKESGTQPTGYSDYYYCDINNIHYVDYSCPGNSVAYTIQDTLQTTCGTCQYCSNGLPNCMNSDTSTMCNSALQCSSDVGDNNYGTGGLNTCQGFCDGQGQCDYADNCTNCSPRPDGCYDGSHYVYSCQASICLSNVTVGTDNDGDGYTVECDNDCDDSNSSIHPNATEICDNIDNDCDGEIDDTCEPPVLSHIDNITVHENELVKIYPQATDPDNMRLNTSCPGIENCTDDFDCDGLDDSLDACDDEGSNNLPENSACLKWFLDANGCHDTYFGNAYTKDSVHYVNYNVQGEIFSFNVSRPDHWFACSLYDVTENYIRIECDSIYDGNGDGQCAAGGGESCARYTFYENHYETITTNSMPLTWNPGGWNEIIDENGYTHYKYKSPNWFLSDVMYDLTVQQNANACDTSDLDDDGEVDPADNCPSTANGDQSDLDADGLGDVCDLCPGYVHYPGLSFNFTHPLNALGEWLPTYDDSGFYTTIVTVSDGIMTDSQEVGITVDNNNRPPYIQPIADITVAEGGLVQVIPQAGDPDNENNVTNDDNILTLWFKSPLNQSGEWQTEIGDAGSYVVNVSVNDGQYKDMVILTIIVTTCTQDSECDNGLHCDGTEACVAGQCTAGTPIDCSGNDLSSIATCDNDPDSNPLTWDYYAGFTSVCDENADSCTSEALSLAHSCDISQCSASCESDSDCGATPCASLDGCYQGTYRQYDDVANTCINDCSCTNNTCSSYSELITDNDGDGYDTECDNDCNDGDNQTNPSAAELCDGIDNNCDGTVDEGFPDADNDGTADCMDPDDDNDGIDDDTDFINGDSSFINSSLNLTVEIDGVENLDNHVGDAPVVIRLQNEVLVEFNFSFSNESRLDLSQVSIEKNANPGVGSVLINGLNLPENTTKTVYVDNLNGLRNLCIKDAYTASITQISGLCNGANEYGINCPGTANGGAYSCILTDNSTNDTFQISGLLHSGVQQQSFCGDNTCNSGETCSSCRTDCGACPSGGGGSSGGGSGGGGGGGGASVSSNPRVTEIFTDLLADGSYAMTIEEDGIDVTEIAFDLNRDISVGKLMVESYGMTRPMSKIPAGIVYQYLHIDYDNFQPDDFSNIVIKFRIPKSWIENNSFDASTAKLSRYYNGIWTNLPTEELKSDSSHQHYQSESPSFSYFAIIGEEATAKPTEEPTKPAVTKTEPKPDDKPEATTPDEEPEPDQIDEPAEKPEQKEEQKWGILKWLLSWSATGRAVQDTSATVDPSRAAWLLFTVAAIVSAVFMYKKRDKKPKKKTKKGQS